MLTELPSVLRPMPLLRLFPRAILNSSLQEIEHLILLKKIDVSNNIIEHVPASIGCCSRVHTLLLNNNRLSSLPAEISKMSLSVLDISHNRCYKFDRFPEIAAAS
jgi:Leucine-rich repeat (LRR) protein